MLGSYHNLIKIEMISSKLMILWLCRLLDLIWVLRTVIKFRCFVSNKRNKSKENTKLKTIGQIDLFSRNGIKNKRTCLAKKVIVELLSQILCNNQLSPSTSPTKEKTLISK